MRIRVLHKPTIEEVDGIRLDQFRPVASYRLNSSLASLFLAEGWGEPVDEDESDAAAAPIPYPSLPTPPNLTRERYPPYIDTPPVGLAPNRRRVPRRRRGGRLLLLPVNR